MTDIKNSVETTEEGLVNELRTLIQTSIREEGIERTIVEMGLSLFQSEATIQELCGVVVALQELILDKKVCTANELKSFIEASRERQQKAIEEVFEQNEV